MWHRCADAAACCLLRPKPLRPALAASVARHIWLHALKRSAGRQRRGPDSGAPTGACAPSCASPNFLVLLVHQSSMGYIGKDGERCPAASPPFATLSDFAGALSSALQSRSRHKERRRSLHLRPAPPTGPFPLPAPFVPAGQVHHRQGPALGLRAILAFLQGIIQFIIFFFKTLTNSSAANEYTAKRRGGGGGGGGGGPPRPPRGPRITGLSDLRDASGGACRTGAGGVEQGGVAMWEGIGVLWR